MLILLCNHSNRNRSKNRISIDYTDSDEVVVTYILFRHFTRISFSVSNITITKKTYTCLKIYDLKHRDTVETTVLTPQKT